MSYILYKDDLPDDFPIHKAVDNCIAIDTEAMGLNFARDRLCMIQLSLGDKKAHLVKITPDYKGDRPNLKKLLSDPNIIKLFHYARFDIATIYNTLGVMPAPIYCTKVGSKLARTFSDKHSLKNLCKDLLGVELAKQEQTSDWGEENLTESQLKYASNDVLYLHALKNKLDNILKREGRIDLAHECFEKISTLAKLDVLGYEEVFHYASKPPKN